MTYVLAIVDGIAPIICEPNPMPHNSLTFDELGMLTIASLGIVLEFSFSG